MKINKGVSMTISNLEDAVNLINYNTDVFAEHLIKLMRKTRKANLFSVIAIVGATYAIVKIKKQEEELKKLYFQLDTTENKEEE